LSSLQYDFNSTEQAVKALREGLVEVRREEVEEEEEE